MKVWSYNSNSRTVEEGGKMRLQNWERKQVEGQGKFYNYKAIAEATYTGRSITTDNRVDINRKYPAKILTISTADNSL